MITTSGEATTSKLFELVGWIRDGWSTLLISRPGMYKHRFPGLGSRREHRQQTRGRTARVRSNPSRTSSSMYGHRFPLRAFVSFSWLRCFLTSVRGLRDGSTRRNPSSEHLLKDVSYRPSRYPQFADQSVPIAQDFREQSPYRAAFALPVWYTVPHQICRLRPQMPSRNASRI
jgi:hypothetical protein